MKYVLMLFTLLLGADFVAGATHKVYVESEDKEADAVVAAFKARLNATERYQAIDASKDEELTVQILCFSLEIYKVNGAICSYVFYYSPTSAPMMMLHVTNGAGLLSSNDRGRIGELLFQAFVTNTTESKIEEANKTIQLNVFIFCSDRENDKYCRPK